MIGTPFKSDDERIQRKVDKLNKKPWEQEVRDEQGRRRFHGAFTGGFSAGYFNTVGTKEGWTPATFVSGKNKERQFKEQTVMDFMDEEDVNDQVGINQIVSKQEFKTETLGVREKSIIAAELPSEIFTPSNTVISNKLLLESGYDEKPKKKLIDSDINKYYRGRLEFKANYQGIGYQPDYDEITKVKHQDTAINKNRIKMSQFDDDVDMGYFNPNDVSEYTFEENNEEHINYRKNNIEPPKFIIDDSKLHMDLQNNFKMPKLPEGYDPFNKPKLELKKGEIVEFGKMNPEKRSSLLGENNTNKFLESKFTKAEITKPSSTDQISNYFNYKVEIPFKNDLAKVARFTKFIAEKEGLIVSENYFNNSHLLTGEEIRHERELFESVYQEEQKLKRAELALKTNNNNYHNEVTELTNRMTKREKIKWRPDKMVCKRFKIKDPFENLKEETFQNKKFIKGETINSLTDIQRQLIKEEIKTSSFNSTPAGIKSTNNEVNTEMIVNVKQDINLFEEIFG